MAYTTKPKKKKKKGKRSHAEPGPGDLPAGWSAAPSSAYADAWLSTRIVLTARSADGCSATVALPATPAPLAGANV